MNLLANGDWELGWDGSWLIYPSYLGNYAVALTGDGIYNSQTGATFTAYDGTQALKVYGQFTGYENETPIYQEFVATEGTNYTFSGMAWMAGEDPIAGSTTYACLSIKYFDDFYNFYGSSDSGHIDINSTTNTWTALSVTSTAPVGATKVQAAVEYWHCVGSTGNCYDGGSVYFDSLVLE
jgi:hypothetical protein